MRIVHAHVQWERPIYYQHYFYSLPLPIREPQWVQQILLSEMKSLWEGYLSKDVIYGHFTCPKIPSSSLDETGTTRNHGKWPKLIDYMGHLSHLASVPKMWCWPGSHQIGWQHHWFWQLFDEMWFLANLETRSDNRRVSHLFVWSPSQERFTSCGAIIKRSYPRVSFFTSFVRRTMVAITPRHTG